MSNFEPVNFPNISSKRRSFVLTPATEHRGQVLEYFNDYRGNGAPPFDFGSLGDTYIDTEALILYARCPNEWRTWPGPSPSKRLAHPRHDTIFLWCTAKNRVSWLLKSSIKKITRSASEVIARIIAAEAFEISTESKTKQTSGSASEVVPQIVVAGASTTSASFKRKISHNDDNPAKKAKSESADTPTPIVALKRKASPDDASHTNPDKAESGDAPTPNVPAALAWVRCKATAQSSSSPHSHPRSVGTNAAPTTRAASPPTLIPIPALAAIGACTFARPVDHPMGPTQQPPQVAKTTPIVANFMHAMRLHGVGRSFSNVNPSAAEAPIVPPATAPRLDSARVDVQSSSPLPRASSEISTGIPPQSPTTSPPPTPPVLRLPSAPAALVVTADRCLDSPSVLTERRRPSGADLGAPPRTSPETPQGTHASVSSIMSAHEASITKHTAVLTHEIETLKRAGHALLWERHALVTERDALMAERNALVAERDVASVARVNATITALKTQNGALKNRNAELEQQKYFLAHERDVLAEARATLTREKDAVITERTALVISNITLKTQNGALKNRTEELARQKSVLASERDALLVERHAVVSGTQNAALKTRNDELVQQKNHLARERDELQRQRYGLVRELESLKMDQDKLARDAESFMLLSKAHKADHQALSQKNNGLERVNAIFTMDNESLTARTESLSATNALTAQNQSLTVQDKHSKHTVSALQPSLDSLKTKNELRRQHERESSVLEVNDIIIVKEEPRDIDSGNRVSHSAGDMEVIDLTLDTDDEEDVTARHLTPHPTVSSLQASFAHPPPQPGNLFQQETSSDPPPLPIHPSTLATPSVPVIGETLSLAGNTVGEPEIDYATGTVKKGVSTTVIHQPFKYPPTRDVKTPRHKLTDTDSEEKGGHDLSAPRHLTHAHIKILWTYREDNSKILCNECACAGNEYAVPLGTSLHDLAAHSQARHRNTCATILSETRGMSDEQVAAWWEEIDQRG